MQIVRDGEGQLQRMASWDSHGSELLPYEPGAADAAAAGRSGSADSGDDAIIPAGALPEAMPAHKIRRIGTKEVVYTRVLPA